MQAKADYVKKIQAYRIDLEHAGGGKRRKADGISQAAGNCN